MAAATVAHPKTYDLLLYAFDEQLCVQPSFLIGQRLARLGALRKVCYFAYEGLPLAIAIVFAMTRSGRTRTRSGGNMDRSGRCRQTSRILAAFMVSAAGGPTTFIPR